MDRRLRLAMTGIILVVVFVGLIATVNAELDSRKVHVCVYDCNGDPIEGAKVLIEGDFVFPKEGTTNANGCYNSTIYYFCGDGSMTVTVSDAGMVATKELILGWVGPPINLDFTLCPSVPVFTPIGILALVSLLAVIAVLGIRKRH